MDRGSKNRQSQKTRQKGKNNMKVFTDYISGDEFFSDSYPHTYIMNDAVIEAKARYVTKGKETVLIATD